MKNFGCVVILVVVLALLLVLFVPWLNAQACRPKPTPTVVPEITPQPTPVMAEQPEPEDRGCKKGCLDEPRKSNSVPTPLPKKASVPGNGLKIFLPYTVRETSLGSAKQNPYPSP